MIKKEITKKIIRNSKYIIYILPLILIMFSGFINIEFNNISFEQLLYNIINTEGANYGIVYKGIIFVTLGVLVVIGILLTILKLYKMLNIKIYINIGYKDKVKKIDVFEKTKIKEIIIFILFLIFSIIISVKFLNIDDYVKSQFESSEIFEKHYVDGRNINIEFPKQKRNLIYIFVESLESSNASKENGGYVEKSYIPKLEELALKNINFSNNDKIGGAYQLVNTTWTVAGMIAQTGGVPLKIAINVNEYKNLGGSLPGAYTLGDILKDNGYKNYLMIGSDADFGGRKDYFENHGNYKIFDYNYAKDNKWIEDDYYVWWGYEDQKLFKFAKDKLLEISKESEPFNFTLLTADTHFVDGYMDKSCEEPFDSKYANAFYCSDNKINNFINWIKKQDFYENTTIIIAGDHLTMQSNVDYDALYSDRTIYNVIINSAVDTNNDKKRIFSAFDLFPTTIASLGGNIEGDRLGLGVNLFSNKKTLVEEYGLKYINDELTKKSFYYDNNILGDTYYKMKEKE